MKLLPRLDFNLIQRHPKVLAGFSDLSALLNVISERTGLTTLHSPMVINFSPPSRFAIQSFLNAVNGFPNRNLFDGAPVNVYRPGIARGLLKGGNLITLTALLGTEWDINTDGAILFLEEVNEKLYEVDRYLTQWILAGKFRKLKGLILGNFRGIKNRDVYNILSSQMKINFPLVNCPYIGHVKNKITLPVGARVELNAPCRIQELEGHQHLSQKENYIASLGSDTVVPLGNGNNDTGMLRAARLGICVCLKKGCSVAALTSSGILVRSPIDAVDLLLNPKRLTATRRM